MVCKFVALCAEIASQRVPALATKRAVQNRCVKAAAQAQITVRCMYIIWFHTVRRKHALQGAGRVYEPVHPLQLLALLRLPSCLLPGPFCLLLTTLWVLCCCFCLLSAPPLRPIPAALAMSASSCTRSWQWGCGVVATIASRCFCLRSCHKKGEMTSSTW